MSTPATEVPDTSQDIRRVAEAARDALTDDMVTRLAGTAGEAMELLDQINRAGLAKAIPALAQMVNNGDLDRLVQLARVYGSAEDALTDEMVGRLAETVGEGLSLLDRLNRGGVVRLIEMMEHMEASGALERVATLLPRLVARMDMLEQMLGCLELAAAETATAPTPRGGIGGLWTLIRDADSQRTLQFMLRFGEKLRTHCTRRPA